MSLMTVISSIMTASRILDLVNHTFVNYIGIMTIIWRKKKELTTAYAGVASTSSSVSDNSTDKNVSESKLSWQEQKEARQDFANVRMSLKRLKNVSANWKTVIVRSMP